MAKEVHNILACYDIRDERRLSKVAKVMKDFGERVLKSVFECTLTRENFEDMRRRVEKIIDFAEDSVIYYFLCEECIRKVQYLGEGQGFVERPLERILV